MSSCQCQGIEDLFSQESVDKELAHYRRKGADKTTHTLTAALIEAGVQGLTLLDIGGGVGAVQYALLEAGARSATSVDASAAYTKAAREEAQRRGLAERLTQQHGNFVDLAEGIEPADIVTLDRVICCYDDMQKLVGLSAARARQLYGLVYPCDTWLVKLGMAAMNLYFRLSGSPFRTFMHASESVEALVNGQGFRQRFYRRTLVWQVVVYDRPLQIDLDTQESTQ